MTKRVLIVEDDSDLRESLAFLLERRGCLVDSAPNGWEALEWLREESHEPDLILLDLMMPVMDGWQLRRELLKDPRLGRIPIVVVSGVEQLANTANTLKAMTYLSKPVDLRRLYALLGHSPLPAN